MRIAVWHNLPSGGGKRALFNHIKALKEKGHYVEAWTTDFSSDNYFSLNELITEHRDPISSVLKNIDSNTSVLQRTRKTISLLKEHSKKCLSQIEAGNFDIIFANSCGITYMPFIGLYSKLPVITFLGEPNRQLFEAAKEGNIWALPNYKFSLKGINRFKRDFLFTYSNRIKIREEVAAARSVKKLLVNSIFSKESIKRAYGIEAEVCYLGVNEKEFNLNPNLSKKNYVVGMGRISVIKNVETAIEIIASIPFNIRPALHWISNGYAKDYLDTIIQLSERLGVEFVKHINIPEHDLQTILSEAAVMIYTSHLEPFGLAPLEANMCGTSVIAIAEGGVRESIINNVNGFLVVNLDVGKVSNLITKFTNNPKYAIEMGIKARQHALLNWNQNQMSENICKYFTHK